MNEFFSVIKVLSDLITECSGITKCLHSTTERLLNFREEASRGLPQGCFVLGE